jgi:hypothetical protein
MKDIKEKLTYEEWRATIKVDASDEYVNDVFALHGIDFEAQVEQSLKGEYLIYCREFEDFDM